MSTFCFNVMERQSSAWYGRRYTGVDGDTIFCQHLLFCINVQWRVKNESVCVCMRVCVRMHACLCAYACFCISNKMLLQVLSYHHSFEWLSDWQSTPKKMVNNCGETCIMTSNQMGHTTCKKSCVHVSNILDFLHQLTYTNVSSYRWLSARLLYLQCVSNEDTIALH